SSASTTVDLGIGNVAQGTQSDQAYSDSFGANHVTNVFVTSQQVSCYRPEVPKLDRKSTRLNSSHLVISYAVFCLKKKKNNIDRRPCLDLKKPVRDPQIVHPPIKSPAAAILVASVHALHSPSDNAVIRRKSLVHHP